MKHSPARALLPRLAESSCFARRRPLAKTVFVLISFIPPWVPAPPGRPLCPGPVPSLRAFPKRPPFPEVQPPRRQGSLPAGASFYVRRRFNSFIVLRPWRAFFFPLPVCPRSTSKALVCSRNFTGWGEIGVGPFFLGGGRKRWWFAPGFYHLETKRRVDWRN